MPSSGIPRPLSFSDERTPISTTFVKRETPKEYGLAPDHRLNIFRSESRPPASQEAPRGAPLSTSNQCPIQIQSERSMDLDVHSRLSEL